jgi:hypothetical protein
MGIDGGSAAYEPRLTAVDEDHALYRLTGDDAASPSMHELRMVCRPVGSQQWIRACQNGSATYWANFDIVNGVLGNLSDGGDESEVVASITDLGGGTYDCRCVFKNPGSLPTRCIWNFLDSDVAVGGLYNYLGNTSDGISVDSTDFIQPRASALADESLVTNPALFTKRGADLAQATDANQPLFYSEFSSINGLPVIYREAGRTSYLSTTHAHVAGLVAGDDTSWAAMGVMSFSGALAQPLRWTGALDYDIPLYLDGAGVKSIRYDGVSISTQTFGGITDADFASPRLCTLIRTGLTLSLYLDGVFASSVTHDDLGSVDVTAFYIGHPTETAPQQTYAEIALFADLSSLGDHATIQAVLMNQAGGAAMKQRWNV